MRSKLPIVCFILLAGCRRSGAAATPTASDDEAPSAPDRGGSSSASAPARVEPPALAAEDAGEAAEANLPQVEPDWCLDGWRALDEGTCYVLPVARPTRLLIYLSGIVPPTPTSSQKENVQRIVAAAAHKYGVAAILPRGRRGIGPKDARDWWAWPTGASDHARYAKEMVASFTSARSRLEQALGRPFDRTYLAGSSSGAYFLASLALAGEIDADGYAAASGGAPGLVTPGARARKRPFYVGNGSGDPTNGGPKALATYLERAGWPVRASEIAAGHGAREAYLTEAFDFWASFELDAGASSPAP